MMPALVNLVLNSNQLTGPLPDEWGAGGSFTSLEFANLVPHVGFPKMSCIFPPNEGNPMPPWRNVRLAF